jgi:uncharacterized repeat protein (TIGR03803 family)
MKSISEYSLQVLVGLIVLFIQTSSYGLETVYNFQLGPRNPEAGLINGSDGNLYGTAYGGGDGGYGMLFQLIPTNGTLNGLVSFGYTNGANPVAPLVLWSTNFYGTTYQGGSNDLGTIFSVATNGTLTPLVSFDGTNGAYPYGGLASDGKGNFYGTTYFGGTNLAGLVGKFGYGTVFKIASDGAFENLYSFDYSHGANPQGALAPGSDGNFYGTTVSGGTSGNGTAFKVITAKDTITNLASFTFANGASPCGGLVEATNSLGLLFYGTTSGGGASSNGTVFVMETNGSLTTLVSFNGLDGSNPQAGLIWGTNGDLYGTTFGGGTFGFGTIFKMTTGGTMTTVVSFNFANGANPQAPLVVGSDGNLYGTTSAGGVFNTGTAFKLTYDGQLTTLASFNPGTGFPITGLMLASNGVLYGTTTYSSGAGNAALFGVTTNGQLPTLLPFNTPNQANPSGILLEGTNLVGSITDILGTVTNTVVTNGITNILITNITATFPQATNLVFYGTTYGDGVSNNGTVFRIDQNGAITNLVNFGITNGSHPLGGLIRGSDGNLYGTTSQGGPADSGTIFKIQPGLTNFFFTLASFNYDFNNNGTFPEGPLLQATNGTFDGAFLGTTAAGGSDDDGTIFMLNTNGVLTTVVSFTSANGSEPESGLVMGNDGNYYGTTSDGGLYGNGTIFELTINGVLTNVISLADTNGYVPQGPLLPGTGDSLYGTTEFGGTFDYGTVFCATPGNAENPIMTVATFNGTNGAFPNGGLAFGPDGDIYGTTADGGTGGAGTVFRLWPDLSCSLTDNGCVVSWSTSAQGYFLQSTTNLMPPVNWVTMPAPSIVGSQYVVTNKIYGGSKFYRLMNPNP